MKNRLVSLLVFSLLFFSSIVFVYAKYLTNNNVTNENAVPSLYIINDTISNQSLNLLNSEIEPGNTYTFSFDINNFKNNKRTENIIDYTVKIDISNNLPLEIELYKNKEKLTLQDNKTSVQTLNNTSNVTDNYELKIKFLDSENNFEYASLIEYIDVLVESNQRL